MPPGSLSARVCDGGTNCNMGGPVGFTVNGTTGFTIYMNNNGRSTGQSYTKQ